MKESYGKGVANHPGPESCVASRKATIEALTGAHAGWVLSCEIIATRVPTSFRYGGRQYRRMRHRKCPRDAAQSETSGMHGNSTRENRETPLAPAGKDAAGRLEKALSQQSSMYVDGESDGRIIPAKCPNKGEQAPAEGMEGRRPAKENIGQALRGRGMGEDGSRDSARGSGLATAGEHLPALRLRPVGQALAQAS